VSVRSVNSRWQRVHSVMSIAIERVGADAYRRRARAIQAKQVGARSRAFAELPVVDGDDNRFLLWVAIMAAVFAVVLVFMPDAMGWFMRK
jgi:hypothetical protein